MSRAADGTAVGQRADAVGVDDCADICRRAARITDRSAQVVGQRCDGAGVVNTLVRTADGAAVGQRADTTGVVDGASSRVAATTDRASGSVVQRGDRTCVVAIDAIGHTADGAAIGQRAEGTADDRNIGSSIAADIAGNRPIRRRAAVK